MKTCTKCQRDLPESGFHARSPGKLRGQCRRCISEFHKRWRATETTGWRARQRQSNRESELRINYGITIADYERMHAEQGGVCASCGNPPTGKGCAATLNVDHDHETGEVRGLLCNPCNQAQGLLRDDPDVIWGLLIYARRHQKPKLRLVA